VPDVKAATKHDVLHILAQHIAVTQNNLSADEVFNALWEREELGSTGIEAGIAIPHGRLKKLAHPILTIGKTESPIEFDAIDDMKTDLFFVVLAPSSGNEHLRVLAQLARLFQTTGFSEQLRYCRTEAEMHRCLTHWESTIVC
jgi:PTS system nitrogen regulatory IIA component